MSRPGRIKKLAAASAFAVMLPAITAMVMPAAAAPSDRATPQTLQCTITGSSFEYTVCEGPFTVPAGQGVYVKLDFSGGVNVDFCVEPPSGGGDFGCTGEISPGSPEKQVWFNNSTGSRRGQLIAGRDGLGADVLAEGSWTIR